MSEPTELEGAGRRGWDRRRVLGAALGGAIVLAVVALLVVGLANRGVSPAIDHALAAGERPPAPSFELPVLVGGAGVGQPGEAVSLERLRGRPVVLNFWASWCGPCEDEAPLLEAIWRRYRGRGVLMLGLNTQDLREDALRFVRETGTTFPSVREGGRRVRDDWGLTGVPETFVIDRRGRVALHIAGPIAEPGQLTVPLDDLLAEAPAGGRP